MTRTLAALAAVLLATGAHAQTAAPTASPAPPSDAATPPAATSAAPAAPAPAVRQERKLPTGTFAIGERSQISINGRAWAEWNNVGADSGSAPGATNVPDRARLSNNSSYLRVRGEHEFATEWRAIAQIEAEFGIDGENGLPFSGTRNTGVGVASPFGTLILGRWDSPMKQTTIGLDPFGGTGIFGYYNVFGQQQASATSSGANRWDRRLNNSLSYTSPSVAGFTALAAYSVGETPRSGTIPVNPFTASGALHYKYGPLYLGVAYEYRRDCGNPDADAPGGASCNQAALGSATQPKGTDQGIRAGASYAFKSTFTKLSVAYEHISLEAAAIPTAPKKTLSRDAYWGSITQGIFTNRHQLILNYGVATSVSGQNVFADDSGTGASYVTAAYRFWLYPDTDVYAAFTQVTNERNASYRFGSGNFGNVPVGSTSTGWGGGIRYMF
ncbi:MAG TPA: porin [Anaeromyxobacter sp.]|nr:porin [Anaeromyxobacter sp.]